MIERKTSTGEKICIFDNLFTAREIFKFQGYASTSLYKRIPVSSSSSNTRSNDETFFGSILSEEDVSNLGIFKTNGYNTVSHFFTDMHIERAWILCAETGTKYLYHADAEPGCITMLCYFNNYWHPEWGGETLFCNGKGEPEIAISCKENRVVIFPSDILHKPSAVTRDAATRYTFTATFCKK